jgi:Fe-S-cluster-containing hydrogenase component 2
MKRFLLPEMGFEYGYCRPVCSRCAEVCPSGAIAPVSPEEKLRTHIGHVVFHADRCIAARHKVTCTACERHCPVKAITLVEGVPVLDAGKCIGCGACENLCPARPLPAMTVDGYNVHLANI